MSRDRRVRAVRSAVAAVPAAVCVVDALVGRGVAVVAGISGEAAVFPAIPERRRTIAVRSAVGIRPAVSGETNVVVGSEPARARADHATRPGVARAVGIRQTFVVIAAPAVVAVPDAATVQAARAVLVRVAGHEPAGDGAVDDRRARVVVRPRVVASRGLSAMQCRGAPEPPAAAGADTSRAASSAGSAARGGPARPRRPTVVRPDASTRRSPAAGRKQRAYRDGEKPSRRSTAKRRYDRSAPVCHATGTSC